MPTERLTIRSTIFASSENEKIAAAVMLITPAMVVASRMEISGVSILGLGEYATKLQIKTQTGLFSKHPASIASAMASETCGATHATPCTLNHARQRCQPSLASAST